jgi:hypothetical protein
MVVDGENSGRQCDADALPMNFLGGGQGQGVDQKQAATAGMGSSSGIRDALSSSY